jgi:hypothetical protein
MSRSFSQDIYRLLDDSATMRVAWWRHTWLRYDPSYQDERESVAALELLGGQGEITHHCTFLSARCADERIHASRGVW